MYHSKSELTLVVRIAPFGTKRRFVTVQKFGGYREDSGHAAWLNAPNTVRFSLCLTIVLIRKSVAFLPPNCANNAPFRSMRRHCDRAIYIPRYL
jgi:hypothetical protein